ncbi:hypothetical protein ES319_D11G065800v1 [Gossypium barbadense]|uniref:Uncharacterized protein n=2 Tax=Gossypium TaxID=3633 RepID=A0A2P5PVB8_GOSBA|nr:hypothetical protein ES319_D11G065800v1 [Gossypium barbadense]PPD66248.1 hypothetical protein GOBAR_DD36869 [Gossypium barbadense]PPR81606.1 hypothetical protein GOBAR_AA39111 [Gossypium barbadense]TYG44068.1 hypothetical protein ES288_D11G068500v1 [Gossypium darwinii]
MVSEDFSFPKITNPSPQFTSLPSLWRVTSLVYPEYGDNNEEEEEPMRRKNLSVSCLSSESEANKRDGEDREKMDMLWEEFNELKRASSLRSRKEVKEAMNSGTGMMIYPKKQSKISLLAVMKTLKIKIFYLGNLVLKN